MTTTKQDFETISAIANRADLLFKAAFCPRPMLEIMMDLEAVHDSVGLRLDELLDADDFNFAHDVVGIAKHLNRETKQLEDCFLPRFSV